MDLIKFRVERLYGFFFYSTEKKKSIKKKQFLNMVCYRRLFMFEIFLPKKTREYIPLLDPSMIFSA